MNPSIDSSLWTKMIQSLTDYILVNRPLEFQTACVHGRVRVRQLAFLPQRSGSRHPTAHDQGNNTYCHMVKQDVNADMSDSAIKI